MAKGDAKEQLHGFLAHYAEGVCTKGELIHCAVLLFDEGDIQLNHGLWQELPEWVKDGILSFMINLSEDDEFYMHNGDAEEMSKKYFKLKYWLLENKLLAQT